MHNQPREVAIAQRNTWMRENAELIFKSLIELMARDHPIVRRRAQLLIDAAPPKP